MLATCRQKELLSLIVQAEAELAFQTLEKGRSILFVEREDNPAVTSAPEGVLREFGSYRGMVIYLAIDNHVETGGLPRKDHSVQVGHGRDLYSVNWVSQVGPAGLGRVG